MSSTRLLSTTLMAALAGSCIALQPSGDVRAEQNQKMGEMTRAEHMEARQAMREEAVRASRILSGNISNGLNPLGQTENLVLDRQGNAVEYVIFESQMMPFEFYVGRGFVNWSDVDLQSGSGLGEVGLRGDVDENAPGPDELRIAQDEAAKRVVSQIIDSPLRIADDGVRRIEDLLIHPETGEITHFIVGWEDDALFSATRRAIPADAVAFEDGMWQTGMRVTAIEDSQPFNPALF